jgi:hypothetical protein
VGVPLTSISGAYIVDKDRKLPVSFLWAIAADGALLAWCLSCTAGSISSGASLCVIVNHIRPDALDCGHGGAPVFLDPGNARSVHDAISRPTASRI